MRNLLRRPTRTLLALTTLSMAGASFISAFNIRASMMATADRLYGAGTFGSISRYALDQHMLMIYVFLLIAAGVLGSIGGFGLITTTSLNVLERRREVGVMRAIGATPSVVSTLFIVESTVLALVSSVLAVIAATVITVALGRLFAVVLFRGHFDLAFPAAAAAGWLAIALLLAVMASLVPAVNASRRSVREAISYE